jgi:hypothetical protein
MDYEDFQARLERTISEVIRTCHSASWDENHITFSLVDQLFKRNRMETIEGLDRPFKIIWDFRKLRRPEETDFGDIAVLVHLTTWAGETVEGVGLLEAKRRNLGNSSFAAAKTPQLKTILSKAPNAQLLLYDYENVTSCMDNCVGLVVNSHRYRHHSYPAGPFTHCVSVPIGIALQQGKYNTDLHKFGVPLSHQLSARYFRGFDLETNSKTLDAVKGNVAKHGGARTIVLVGVSTGSADPVLPEVNDNKYGRE